MRKDLFFAALLLGCMHVSYGQQAARTMLRLPDTGQNNSYTFTFGEDSDYLIHAPAFTVHGDGTVTDTVTGLMWAATDGGEMTFENARIYTDSLTLAGYTDWRLPSAKELFSIQDLQRSNPSLDPAVFTAGTAEYWWSSETQVNDSTKVWVTNAGGGIGNHRRVETISAGGTKRFHARAVRQPLASTMVSSRFTDNGDGSVTDHLTDLVWQSVPYVDSLTWEQALGYADTLGLAGETDWRLPNIKELQSLTDLQHYNPSFDTSYFHTPSQGKYWSSTTLQNQPLQAWYLDSRYGITTYSPKTARNLLSCVRGNTTISTFVAPVVAAPSESVVYPNPFTDRFALSAALTGCTVTITDLYGNQFYEGRGLESFDFSSLSSGIYVLSFPFTDFPARRIVKR
jgi:hypothetical protein